jgi:hypothetical protein
MPRVAVAQRLWERLVTEWGPCVGTTPQMVLVRLDPIIRGWSAYRHYVSTWVFNELDSLRFPHLSGSGNGCSVGQRSAASLWSPRDWPWRDPGHTDTPSWAAAVTGTGNRHRSRADRRPAALAKRRIVVHHPPAAGGDALR